MPFGPRLLRGGEAAAVAEQKVGEPMPRAEQVGANVFPAAQEIADGLFELRRNVDRGERVGAIEDGELAGIAPVGFDAISWPARNEGGGDDVTRHAVRGERAL